MLQALWNSGRSFNKAKVENLLAEAAEKNGIVQVTNVVTKEKKQGRPVPLNTVAMLKACSKALGIGPHQALQTAERLYLMGYLSYPRTESSAYPNSFDIRGTLQDQATDGRWGKYVRDLLQQGFNKSRGGVDMGDHPPITPCRAAGFELSGDMARVYDLVVRHFIASVSNDAIWQSTSIEFEVDALGDQGKFTLSGKEVRTDLVLCAVVLSIRNLIILASCKPMISFCNSSKTLVSWQLYSVENTEKTQNARRVTRMKKNDRSLSLKRVRLFHWQAASQTRTVPRLL